MLLLKSHEKLSVVARPIHSYPHNFNGIGDRLPPQAPTLKWVILGWNSYKEPSPQCCNESLKRIQRNVLVTIFNTSQSRLTGAYLFSDLFLCFVPVSP